jgi:hypothetical protein
MSFIDYAEQSERSSVRVALRVRPLNKREKDSKSITSVGKDAITLYHPETKKKKRFSYDFIYDTDTQQENIYKDIGNNVINNAFKGYNCCVFAYGLTGSGKTFSMMGSKEEPGLIPRICQDLFDKQQSHNDMDQGECEISYRIELSYLEIYSERVIDLMGKHDDKPLKVRQHPDMGPYVENLTTIAVENYASIKRVIDNGNKARHVVSTNMNDRSSRSHAILTVLFTQVVKESSGIVREVVSKINLVDLAGSERVESSGVTGVNFKEAIEINKSLSALGLVISKLADKSSRVAQTDKLSTRCLGASKKERKTLKKAKDHIPFRDSVLTWILKESLGGNSKTYMIATISPSSLNYNETLSTLRYASNAKQIINTVKINEDQNDKIIRVLRDEIKMLKECLTTKRASGILNTPEVKKLKDDIVQREDLMRTREKSWTAKLSESRDIAQAVVRDMTTKQEEFRIKLQHVNNERDILLAEMTNMKATMSDQELAQQQVLEIELSKVQSDFEQKRQEFEQVKIVETAVSLQEYYETRLDTLREQYEEKMRGLTLIDSKEMDELKIVNSVLKDRLNKNQNELHLKMERFTNERAVLSKRIQQLTSKIHTLEISVKSEHAQTHEHMGTAHKKEEEKQIQDLQIEHTQLIKKMNENKKILDDINNKHSLISKEIEHTTEKLDVLKVEYSELNIKFTHARSEYDKLIDEKQKLHDDIKTISVKMAEYITSSKLLLAEPTLNNLTQINDGFKKIFKNIQRIHQLN